MKEMNRRTFLKLSGASAVMLALAPVTIAAPPAPQVPALPQKRLPRRRSL